MWLTDLGDAARKSGLPVVEVPGWKTHGHGEMSGVRTIVPHHTAGPATGEYPSMTVVREGRPGLDGPLAQLGLGRSGTVYVIAAGVCWHAGVVFSSDQDNYHAIGIEAEATGTATWPRVQYEAYARLCKALCDHYKLPYDRILGHKEIAKPLGRKIDPNFDMAEFRRVVPTIGDDMTPDQSNKLDRVHHELTLFLENRRGDGSGMKDTVLGYATNADAFGSRNEKAIAALSAKVDRLSTGNVDYKILAKAVADELQQRLVG